MTPLSEFEVLTPLGPAICTGVCDEGTEDVEWCTWIKATGECWFWRNQHIRRCVNITTGRHSLSPIPIPKGLEPHIKRYQAAGWLAKPE